MKRRILCSCVNTDGSKCGRSVTDGSNPPICHIHRGKVTGQPVGRQFGAEPETPEAIVRKLLADSDASVRLRALDMWIKHFESRKSDPENHSFVRFLTDDEKDDVRFHLDCLAAIKEKVYDRHPELVPDAITLDRRRRSEDAARLATEHGEDVCLREQETPPARAAQPMVAPEPNPEHDSVDIAASRRTELPRTLWGAVGVFELNGVVTHRLGDEHAQQILTGEITYEVARAAHEAAQLQAERISAFHD